MSASKKWFECNQCEKRLSSYKSLWRHKKICKSKVDDSSTLNIRSATRSLEQKHLKDNDKDAEFNTYIDQIINGSPKKHLQDEQVVGEGPIALVYQQKEENPRKLKDDKIQKIDHANDMDISLPCSSERTEVGTSEVCFDLNKKNDQPDTYEKSWWMGDMNENEDGRDINIAHNKESIGEDNEKDVIVYGIPIPNKALTNFELSKYCAKLNIATLRGIFARDSLPACPQRNECGIVNLNTSSEPGSHWVCYFKTGTDRMYFDSFGQITPYEVQMYLKTKPEIDQQVIKRNTDIVQSAGTKVCGHLCLYVLKSLSDGMTFGEVLESLSNPQEGKGIKWTDELANELHKPLRHNFQKRYVFAQNVDDIWSADLVDMRALSDDNDGYNYILMIVDVMSKYGWARPMLRKTGKALKEALEDVFKEGHLPKMIWADEGTEFYNKDVKAFLKKHKVSLYSTGNPEKSSVVERWNRTMKTWLWKYFTANGTHRFIDVLQALVKKYNSTLHRSTKLTPVEARNPSKYMQLFRNLYLEKVKKMSKLYKGKVPKFKVGDKVRLAVLKDKFEKAYIINYTDKIYTIKEVKKTTPFTYIVEDDKGNVHKGSFYEQDLQKTRVDRFRIEKIVDWKTINGKRYGLVKWMDYDDSYNSWEPADEL
jgi:hypothetical protein